MIIWLDGQCFQSASAQRGIGRYGEELIRALAARTDAPEVHISFNSAWPKEADTARQRLAPFIPLERQHIWHGHEDGPEASLGQTTHRRMSAAALCHHVLSLSPDVAISLSPFEGDTAALTPFLPPKDFPLPTAAVFYDAIPHRLPDMYLHQDGLKRAYNRRLAALANFDQLLAISAYAQSEAQALVPGVSAANISAGIGEDFITRLGEAPPEKAANVLAQDGVSLLYVGGFDRRKNLSGLVQAIGRCAKAGAAALNLILVGQKQSAELDQVRLEWAGQGLEARRLQVFGFANADELAALYEGADLVVQPSLLEGFGLTALEAMAAGTPVLASNTGALPELITDPACLFDPTKPDSISDCLMWAIQNLPDLTAGAAANRARAQAFTWAETAERAMDSLTALARKATGQDLAAARRYTAAKVRDIGYDADIAATLLAGAEITAGDRVRTRLLVDVTATARIDHATGIQRVVNNIARHLPAALKDRGGAELTLMGADDDLGFFPVTLGAGDAWDARRNERLSIGRGDTVLMLDSSWEHHRAHHDLLQLARLNGATVISVLYDMVPARTPAFCHSGMPPVFSAWLTSALEVSDGFVCISKAVADELLHYLKGVQHPRAVSVGHWPLGTDFAAPARTPQTLRPSFLSVGTLEPRKGHRIILDAFDRLWADGTDVELCLIGRKGWGVDPLVVRLLSHPEFGHRLTWRSSVEDAELVDRYAACTALISASFAEGFGLPLIEAGQMGKPVIASDLPVFREVSEGLDVAFFPAGDSAALANLVRAQIDRGDSARSAVGVSAPSTNWSDSARALLALIGDDAFQANHDPDQAGQISTGAAPDGIACVTLLYPPDLFATEKALRATVRLFNQSTDIWANGAMANAAQGAGLTPVRLAAMSARANGEWLSEDPIYVDLPFPLEPGAEAILSVDIPARLVQQGAASVFIAPLQPGIGLLAPPLEVDLHQTTLPTIQNARAMFDTALGRG